jgi:hypothetical protein
MSSITDPSRRIGEIIPVLEGVAFQRTVLALNTAKVEELAATEQEFNGQVGCVTAALIWLRLRAGDRSIAETGAVDWHRAQRLRPANEPRA